MIDYEFDKASRILRVHPESSLHKQDFIELAKAVDPEIEASGDLAGLIIDVAHFPGWDSFGAVVTHMRFVHDHHKHVKKIAVVTDSHLGDLAEHLVRTSSRQKSNSSPPDRTSRPDSGSSATGTRRAPPTPEPSGGMPMRAS